jgi:hypothetical protein
MTWTVPCSGFNIHLCHKIRVAPQFQHRPWLKRMPRLRSLAVISSSALFSIWMCGIFLQKLFTTIAVSYTARTNPHVLTWYRRHVLSNSLCKSIWLAHRSSSYIIVEIKPSSTWEANRDRLIRTTDQNHLMKSAWAYRRRLIR